MPTAPTNKERAVTFMGLMAVMITPVGRFGSIKHERGLTGDGRAGQGPSMKGEFTAIVEPAPEGGYWAICPEVPGANGQGETVEEATKSLRDAIRLIFEDRIEDMRRGLPDDAIQTVVAGKETATRRLFLKARGRFAFVVDQFEDRCG